MSESREKLSIKSIDNTAEILSAQQSSKLCQACGICCTGAFFSHVNVSKKEAETFDGTFIKTYTNQKGKPVFAQPCPALSGTSCSIYDTRPGSCRGFLCDLTRNVMNGRADFDDALEAVADIKALSDWLLSNVPLETTPETTQASAELRSQVENLFKAWQSNEDKAQADGAAKAIKPNKGLMVLLTKLEPGFVRKQANTALSTEDKEYITNAFAFAKLCDRLFTKMPLLRKYGQLVQRF